MIVANNHSAVRSLSPIMMDLSKKDRVEDAYKVKVKAIKHYWICFHYQVMIQTLCSNITSSF
ncbi:hypothetical protein JP88_004725 [Salmonella enterica subsp. enterica]|nr:hypothetical protein [Salmonella enterica]EAX6579820.1 hypothetical protein [Salmonella enterica]ECT9551302.1 hypothetical protein [Salmonella enterica]EDW0613254.1 hypothetical protein [Salmonella enterica subsp. enterica serovar Ball]